MALSLVCCPDVDKENGCGISKSLVYPILQVSNVLEVTAKRKQPKRFGIMEAGMTTFIIQVTNVAPAASLDQMKELFGYLGKIKDIKLYPSESYLVEPQSKICYIQYSDSSSVGVAQHLTNTVFIDRALIVVPIIDDIIPDEAKALSLIDSNLQGFSSGLSPVINEISGVDGSLVITTIDPRLTALGLPQYPPLPANMDPSKIEEIRRTVCIGNLASNMTADKLLNFVNQIGEVKYVRMAGDETQPSRYAFVEFTDQMSVAHALQYNGVLFENRPMKVSHSSSAIVKPQPKSLETAQKEIDEAMKRVKEAQSLITAAIEPELEKDKRKRYSRSRSTSRRRSRSASRRGKRSRSRSKRSRSRRRSRSNHRSRRRSRSGSKKRTKKEKSRSRSKDRKKSKSPRRRKGKSRSRSRDKKKRHRSKSRSRSATPSKSKSSKSSKSKESSRSEKKKSSEKATKNDIQKTDVEERKSDAKVVETTKLVSKENDVEPPVLTPEILTNALDAEKSPPVNDAEVDLFSAQISEDSNLPVESLKVTNEDDFDDSKPVSSDSPTKMDYDINEGIQSKDVFDSEMKDVGSKSPTRERSPSPRSHRSRSPSDRSSNSPVKSKTKSSKKRESRSVSKARSVSPRRKPSPVKKRTRSRSKNRSPSRSKKRSRSRSKRRSRSRSKRRSRSRSKKRSRSISKHRSRSPRKTSKRKKSRSPVPKRRRSRSNRRQRSRSGTRSSRRISPSPRHSKRRSVTPKRYSRSPKRYSITPRRRSRTPRRRSRTPKRHSRSPSYQKNRRRSRSPIRRRGSRRSTPLRRSRTPKRRSRSKTPKRESKHKRRKSRDDSRSRDRKKKDLSDSERGSSKETKVFRNYDEEEKGYDSSQDVENPKMDPKQRLIGPVFEGSKGVSSSDSDAGKMDISSD